MKLRIDLGFFRAMKAIGSQNSLKELRARNEERLKKLKKEHRLYERRAINCTAEGDQNAGHDR